MIVDDHTRRALGYLPLIGPLVLLVLSIPLALQLVPPNRVYGFRTPKTLSNPRIWYEANRLFGINFIIASIVMAVLVMTMKALFDVKDTALISAGLIGGSLIAGLVSSLQLRRL
jgi:uncharacterized membrane protein